MKPDPLSALPSSPLRIVLGYVLFGALWILFSDLLLVQLIPAPWLSIVSIAKGWVFIALTALLLYHLIGRQLAKMAQLNVESQENEARLRTLGDNLPDSYVFQYLREADGTQRFLYLSAGVERLHGVRRQDGLRDAGILFGQIDPEQLPAVATAEEVSLQNMTDFRMEVRMCRADGQWRWFQLCSRPRRKADGQVLWDGVATDITARRQMEESLAEQKKFTEALIENSAAATFVLDAQHKVVLWNKACAELTGMTAADLIGTDEHWRAFYDHERPCLADIVLEANAERLASLYATHAPSTLVPDGLHAEGWYQNLNGRDRYIVFDAAPVYDSRGNLLAVIETIQDITEQKRAEEGLYLQGAALKAAANAIVITDRSGVIEWVNPAFTALTGYSEGEAIGKNPRLVKSGAHEQALYKELWDTLLAGEVWRGEMMNRRKDGTFYPEGQTITPVKNAQGEITHFIAIKRDLTENHKLEAQLQHAQKMESIGTLAGGIAHDLNNILTAIIGYGTLALMKMAVNDPQRPHIQHMLEASDRATRLTKDLLLFSRKQVVDRKPLDLNTVVAKAEKFLTRVIGEDIACQTIHHPAPLPVLADDYQLEQVLMNLVTNARDAMPHGGALTLTTGTIKLDSEFVSTHGFGKPGAYALITVTDSGCGMDEATRLRVFEPYFTTKEVGKGTGLGLAVTYGIIKQHDGYINVYSEPGTGSTFRVYLPLVTTAGGAEPRPAEQEAASVRGTETILLAEDDEQVRELTRSVLTEFGYTVIAAVDGADAVQKFVEFNENIDLLLFDLIMPKMNGKEALDEIRKIRPEIKAIFSSGYAPETIRQKAALANGAHLIAKPAPPLTLLQKVRSVLDEGAAS